MTKKIKEEMVNSPKHYQIVLPDGHECEVIHVIEALSTKEEMIGAMKYNTLKYISRVGKKDTNIQELKKGMYYLKKWIELEETITMNEKM